MSITKVQGWKVGPGTIAGHSTCVLDAVPTAGNIVVVFGYEDGSNNLGTPTDTFGDSGGGSWAAFTSNNISTGMSGRSAGFWRVIGTGAVLKTVDCTNAGFGTLYGAEFHTDISGAVWTKNAEATGAAGENNSPTPGSKTSTGSGDFLCIAACVTQESGQTKPTGYTDEVTDSPFQSYRVADKFLTTTSTESFTWTASTGPKWGAQGVIFNAVSSGPNNYTQSLTASMTPTGSKVMKTLHALSSASCGPVGAVAKSTAHHITAATMTLAGSIVRRAGKALAGSMQFSYAMSKAIGSGQHGSMAPSGALTKALMHALSAASMLLAGNVVKNTLHALSAATLNQSGSMVRMAGKACNATMTSVGSMVKSTTHTLSAASMTLAGNVVKKTLHTLVAAAISLAGTVAGVLVSGAQLYTQAFDAVMQPTGALVRSTAYHLAASCAAAGALVRSTAHSLPATALGMAGSVARTTSKVLAAASVACAGAMVRTTGKALAGSVALAGTMRRAVSKHLSAATLGLQVAFAAGRQAYTIAFDAALSLVGMLELPYSMLRRYIVTAQNRILALVASIRVRGIESQDRVRGIESQDRENDVE